MFPWDDTGVIRPGARAHFVHPGTYVRTYAPCRCVIAASVHLSTRADIGAPGGRVSPPPLSRPLPVERTRGEKGRVNVRAWAVECTSVRGVACRPARTASTRTRVCDAYGEGGKMLSRFVKLMSAAQRSMPSSGLETRWRGDRTELDGKGS